MTAQMTAQQIATGMSSLGRASLIIGAGTMVSRLTGLLRNVALVAAIGSTGTRAGDAFAVANQLPNNIYAIISTGVLTAVIVPQIVKVTATDPDGGKAFISKLFTLGTVVLLVTTALAMVAAPWLVQLYSSAFTPEQVALATTFAYWLLPQIFFYGLYALVGETLNARRIFGPFTWAPIVNNVVSIAGFMAVILLFGSDRTAVDDWNSTAIALLAGTATLGIVVQAGVLLLFWRRTRVHVRPDFRWRGVGLNRMGKLAGWTFLMVLAGQVAGLVQTRIVGAASGGDNASVFAMQNAWLLFMLPYSIIVISIGTPYFTQLSEHAAAGRDDEVRADIGRSIRILGLFIVIATTALAAAAVPAARIFTNSTDGAVALATVLICFLVGLIPLAVLFVIQRSFYAYGDTRTPFFFTIFQCALVIVTALVAAALVQSGALPLEYLTATVALGQSIASLLQVVLATWLLRRRLGNLQLGGALRALGLFIVTAVLAGASGWFVYTASGGTSGWMASDKLLGAAGTVIVGSVSIAVYVLLLTLLRAPELSVATGLVRRILKR